MPRLSIEDRLELMEMVTSVLAEAVKNPEVTRDVELQTTLLEELFQTMVGLIEGAEEDYEDDDSD